MSTIELGPLETADTVLDDERDEIRSLGPESNGLRMTKEEFLAVEDRDENYRYELINGVVIVSPPPSAGERGPNDILGHWLRTYHDTHPQGASLDDTVFEHEIDVGRGIRRADRVIWAGLGRQPHPQNDPPTIVVEFVSPGSVARRRDYQAKRREYTAIGVREYWIIDRFRRTLTLCRGDEKPQIVKENATYTTPLIPGFELKLGELPKIADRWSN